MFGDWSYVIIDVLLFGRKNLLAVGWCQLVYFCEVWWMGGFVINDVRYLWNFFVIVYCAVVGVMWRLVY